MLTDPQSVTIDAIAYPMPRTETQATKSVYTTATGDLKMTVSHQESKGRTRRMVRLDRKKIAADPLTAVNQYQTAAVYLVTDTPLSGFTIDEIDDIVQGFKTWLSTANVSKVLGSEH